MPDEPPGETDVIDDEDDEHDEHGLLQAFVEPFVRDVRRTVSGSFSVSWYLDGDDWWWSCWGTASLFCERGDVRATVAGPNRWAILAGLAEHIADNAFDQGPAWPLCPEHRNHALNAKSKGRTVKWTCTKDGVVEHWPLGSVPKGAAL